MGRAPGAIIRSMLHVATVGGFRNGDGSDAEPAPAPSPDVVEFAPGKPSGALMSVTW